MTPPAQIDTAIDYVAARTARARLVGGVLRVRMPRHWSSSQQADVLARFRRWAERQRHKEAQLPPLEGWDGRRWGEGEFGALVRRINDETLRAPLAGVRIGRARHSRLAQANTRTRVLTFSRYAIDGMPERALRYLILHELAHLFEPNHSDRFWGLVARHEPDWRSQRLVAQAHHARMVDRAELAPTPVAPGPPAGPAGGGSAEPGGHPFGPLFAFVPAR